MSKVNQVAYICLRRGSPGKENGTISKDSAAKNAKYCEEHSDGDEMAPYICESCELPTAWGAQPNDDV